MGKIKIVLKMKKIFWSMRKMAFKWMKSKKLPNWYMDDLNLIIKQRGDNRIFENINHWPILNEKYIEAGEAKGHYFHQDLYAAQKIYENKPIKHVDIGSRIDGFVAHVASYRNIELMDIRPLKSSITNVTFREANLLELTSDLENYCDSISSLHVIEHFGLGRYGDPIDYFGYIKALDNIKVILQKDGLFYFSVPIGPQRIEFNAHRVFSLEYLIQILKERYLIVEFSYVNDEGYFYRNFKLNEEDISSNLNCNYGCGIFVLKNNK
jgi:hypothetical protein